MDSNILMKYVEELKDRPYTFDTVLTVAGTELPAVRYSFPGSLGMQI